MKHLFAIICCMLMSAVSQAQSEQFSVKMMNADNGQHNSWADVILPLFGYFVL